MHALQGSDAKHACETASCAMDKAKRIQLFPDQTLLSSEFSYLHQVYRSQLPTHRRGTQAEFASSLLFLTRDLPHGSIDGSATMSAPASAPESASRGGPQMEAASHLGEGQS